MCTLVETLLSHPQGVIHGVEAVGGTEEESSSLVATMKAGARVQAAGSLVDWLGTAKIALQVEVLSSFPLHSHQLGVRGGMKKWQIAVAARTLQSVRTLPADIMPPKLQRGVNNRAGS